MSQCIYTGADESAESFSSTEHIFPKCIGGIHTLPKGWVCDSVNSSLSGLERGFARQNPTVTITRMFLPQTGRKKHKNRNLIGIFRSTIDSNDFSLGYISNGIPYPIDQLCISTEIPVPNGATIPVKTLFSPNESKPFKEQVRAFWDQVQLFDGNVCVLKEKTLPKNKLLLGYKDTRWYLGLSEQQEIDAAKTSIQLLIEKFDSISADDLLDEGKKGRDKHQVQVQFSIQANLSDIMRVYAKIALNCLAELKGHKYVMDKAFDGIKKAILTGKNIMDYVFIPTGPNTIKTVFSRFEGSLNLGKNFHATTIFYNKGTLYSEVALYGYDNPYLIKLGQVSHYCFTDCYICDWENGKEYNLEECVVQICNHDEEP